MMRFYMHLLGFALIVIVVTEGFYRFVIPNSTPLSTVYDAEHQIRVFDNNVPDGKFVTGRLGEIQFRWHINNYGWKSPRDYSPVKSAKMRIAVIGDSYVEGMYNNPEDYIAEQLSNALQNQAEVYSFGIANASLSHSLAITRYVEPMFQPDVYCYLYVNRDVMESDADANPIEGIMQYRFMGDSVVERPAAPYQPPSRWEQLFQKTPLRQYLMLNAQWGGFNWNVFAKKKKTNPNHYNLAVLYTLHQLRHTIGDKPMIILTEADLDLVYQPSKKTRPTDLNYLRNECDSLGIPYIDLTRVFQDSIRSNGKRFDYGFNKHYTAYGNAVVANAIALALAPQMKTTK